MYELLSELGAELLGLVAYGFVTVALSVAGLVAEYNSLQNLLHGDQLLSVWFAFIGAVALAFAWTVVQDKLVPTLQDARRDATGDGQ